jgi:sugar lactone lactonase YvrE
MTSTNDTTMGKAAPASALNVRLSRRARSLVVTGVLATVLMSTGGARATSTSSDEFPAVIVLPGATSAEGIAVGQGSTFYAGDFLTGDIYRGDLRSGQVELFVDAPAGRMAVGLKADVRRGLLFVAGGFTGQAYVYDLDSGGDVATFQLGGLINDVVLTRDAAWFTDSTLPHLYRIPTSPGGSVRTVVVSGPAADLSGFPNLNGITATADGKTLIVAHSALGEIFTVDAATGASQPIAGVAVPTVDGILWSAGKLYAALVGFNQIVEITLSPDLSSGTVDGVVTSPHFQVPTTVAAFGDRLVAVNAKYDTGFPPTATSFEVVTVRKP